MTPGLCVCVPLETGSHVRVCVARGVQEIGFYMETAQEMFPYTCALLGATFFLVHRMSVSGGFVRFHTVFLRENGDFPIRTASPRLSKKKNPPISDCPKVAGRSSSMGNSSSRSRALAGIVPHSSWTDEEFCEELISQEVEVDEPSF